MPDARLQRTRESYDWNWWLSEEEKAEDRRLLGVVLRHLGKHVEVTGLETLNRSYSDSFDEFGKVH
jgi:hypothetical protein